MYIRKLEIKNIRSIEHFEMTFPEGKEAGWHVLIGDNGSGKSTIVKSAALGLLRPDDIYATREDWNNWLKKDTESGNISILINKDKEFNSGTNEFNSEIKNQIVFERLWEHSDITIFNEFDSSKNKFNEEPTIRKESIDSDYVIVSNIQSFGETVEYSQNISSNRLRKAFLGFSVAYGPFRRFTGGNKEKEELFRSHPRLGAHLSVFGEDVALSEALNYLRELYITELEKKPENSILAYLKQFINKAELLPHQTTIADINTNGVFFKDGHGNLIETVQMSDGFRSVLSLTLELIRQLIRVYGPNRVFKQIEEGNMIIDLPGVVLVDEIDAHLHPTWQTRIGQWFTKYFPKLQFIVTTHSPLVCRASEKGSIWRLAAPGSNQLSGEVTGLDRDRLVYGNVLDAYGTEVFGQEVERSEQSKEKLERLAQLSQLNAYGKISDPEKKEMQALRKILITDDTTEF